MSLANGPDTTTLYYDAVLNLEQGFFQRTKRRSGAPVYPVPFFRTFPLPVSFQPGPLRLEYSQVAGSSPQFPPTCPTLPAFPGF